MGFLVQKSSSDGDDSSDAGVQYIWRGKVGHGSEPVLGDGSRNKVGEARFGYDAKESNDEVRGGAEAGVRYGERLEGDGESTSRVGNGSTDELE